MSQYPSLPTRWWRRRPWRSTPLMRASDRIEALVWLFAIIVMLIAVPVAGAAGTAGYTAAPSRIQILHYHATDIVVAATRTAGTRGRDPAARTAAAPHHCHRHCRTT